MEFDDWVWAYGPGLGPDSLEPDGGRGADVVAAAAWSPAVDAGAAAIPMSLRGWGPRGVDPAATAVIPAAKAPRRVVTRGRGIAAVLVAAMVAGIAGVVLTRAPLPPQGGSSATAIVDSGADLDMQVAAALRVTPVPSPSLGPRPPGRLIIRSIGVDAQVIGVGVDKDGNMAVTNESYTVGWYNRGPAPGDAGDAVMDGHLDWYDTSRAVFYNLRNVHKGDDIVVQRLDGTVKHFKITNIQTVAYNARVPGLFASGGAARLSLITCGGPWDKRTNQYLERVIVDATLV
ncbi:MAG: hypothetical protein QOE92_1501 [Chloroflexota bacterium]|jgi:LPXTG-site transpeptidase (sortase) family protein|nr:hypothetical protein [Chloroflexota bacterium]